MNRYVARRLLLVIPTLFGVTALIFLVLRVVPGNPIDAAMSAEAGSHVFSEQEIEAISRSLGLDRSLIIQYLDWLADIFKGDLGHSFWNEDTTIREIIMRRAAITGQIAVMATIVAWIIGLPVGIIGAIRRNSPLDYVTRFLVTLFMAIPGFWLGLVFVMFTIIVFYWRPPLTLIFIWDDPWRNMHQTLGPAIAYGLGFGAAIARMSRGTLLEVIRDDYIRTARAKGLGEGLVMWRHALKNAVIPVITLSGLQLAAVMGGSVAMERAFSVPGLGFTLVEAISFRDYWLIQNLVLVFGVAYVLVNLAIDLTYGWLDPRIRYS